jgi:hypothetical protein
MSRVNPKSNLLCAKWVYPQYEWSECLASKCAVRWDAGIGGYVGSMYLSKPPQIKGFSEYMLKK